MCRRCNQPWPGPSTTLICMEPHCTPAGTLFYGSLGPLLQSASRSSLHYWPHLSTRLFITENQKNQYSSQTMANPVSLQAWTVTANLWLQVEFYWIQLGNKTGMGGWLEPPMPAPSCCPSLPALLASGAERGFEDATCLTWHSEPSAVAIFCCTSAVLPIFLFPSIHGFSCRNSNKFPPSRSQNLIELGTSPPKKMFLPLKWKGEIIALEMSEHRQC